MLVLESRVVGRGNVWHRRVVGKLVHTDDHGIAALDALLLLVGAARDLFLEERRGDGLGRSSQFIHALQQLHRLLLELRREMLHEVAPGQGIRRACHSRLVRQDLLGAERDRRRLLRGQRQRNSLAAATRAMRAAPQTRFQVAPVGAMLVWPRRKRRGNL